MWCTDPSVRLIGSLDERAKHKLLGNMGQKSVLQQTLLPSARVDLLTAHALICYHVPGLVIELCCRGHLSQRHPYGQERCGRHRDWGCLF